MKGGVFLSIRWLTVELANVIGRTSSASSWRTMGSQVAPRGHYKKHAAQHTVMCCILSLLSHIMDVWRAIRDKSRRRRQASRRVDEIMELHRRITAHNQRDSVHLWLCLNGNWFCYFCNSVSLLFLKARTLALVIHSVLKAWFFLFMCSWRKCMSTIII